MCNTWFWGICCCFITGLLVSSTVGISIEIIGVLAGLFLFCGYLIKPRNSLQFGIITGCLFFFLGVLRFQLSVPSNQKNHIVHLKNTSRFYETIFEVSEILSYAKNWDTYKVKILQLNHKKYTGFVLMKLKKQGDFKLQTGEIYVGNLQISPLKKDCFDYGFHYNNWLITQNITHISWAKDAPLKLYVPKKNLWLARVNTFREKLQTSLEKLTLPPKVLQFTEALIFGNKKNMEKQLLNDFSNAGVIHILAISGLHIGIIYIFCIGLLKLLFYKHKHRYFKSVILLIILWSFVGFTGSSASALRATTMFSCFEISKLWLRKQHPLNALFLAVFILVIINPTIIYSVGFQLSVIAVVSIIIGAPIFNNLWQPTHFIFNYLWRIVGVSVSAQIGLLPLSIYYFHQIPGLFLIANIPIMLGMPFLMGFAFIIVLGNYFFMLPTFIIKGYTTLIQVLLNFVHWVASFENFIAKDIYISIYSAIGCYFIMGGLCWWSRAYKQRINTLYVALLGIIFLCFTEIYTPFFTKEVWLFNDYKNTIIAEIASKQLTVFSEYKLSALDEKYKINPIINQLHSKKIKYHKLKEAYTFNNKKILIVNRSFIPNLEAPVDVIILSSSPKINLDRLITQLHPKCIVITAHNKFYLTKKWEATCKKYGIPYWNVSKQGSLPLNTWLYE